MMISILFLIFITTSLVTLSLSSISKKSEVRAINIIKKERKVKGLYN